METRACEREREVWLCRTTLLLDIYLPQYIPQNVIGNHLVSWLQEGTYNENYHLDLHYTWIQRLVSHISLKLFYYYLILWTCEAFNPCNFQHDTVVQEYQKQTAQELLYNTRNSSALNSSSVAKKDDLDKCFLNAFNKNMSFAYLLLDPQSAWLCVLQL